jgi:ABC-type xylose transport system permease subunit
VTLKDIIPAAWRQIVYAVYAVIGFIIGGVQVAYATAGEGQPEWLLVALAVLAYAGVALGIVAGSNVTPPEPVQVEVVEPYVPEHRAPGEGGYVSTRTLAVAALVLAVLVVVVLLT